MVELKWKQRDMGPFLRVMLDALGCALCVFAVESGRSEGGENTAFHTVVLYGTVEGWVEAGEGCG